MLPYSNQIFIDYVPDDISIDLTGSDWATVTATGVFLLKATKAYFPDKDSLPAIPEWLLSVPGIDALPLEYEFRVTRMDANFVQVELEVVGFPTGFLNALNPGLTVDTVSYSDTVWLINYSNIEYTQFRNNFSVQGLDKWMAV